MRIVYELHCTQLQAFFQLPISCAMRFFCSAYHSFHSFDVLRHTCDIPTCVRLISPASRARLFCRPRYFVLANLLHHHMRSDLRFAMRFKIASSLPVQLCSFAPDC